MANKSYADLYEEQGLDFVTRSGDNWSSKCPFHDDFTASFSVEVVKGLYKCFSPSCWASAGGDFKRFYEKKTGKSYADTLFVPWEEVNEWHHRLLADPVQCGWLGEKRGLTVETVNRFKLGHDGERFTIPIVVEERVTNIRRYSNRKGVSVKVLSYKQGYGKVQLFPWENMSHEEIVLCEGEMDCLLANQLGYNAVTATGGAGNFPKNWAELFKGKVVHILYDIDPPGRAGARKVANVLNGVALQVRDVLLPINTPANGDLTDYIVTHGYGKADLDALIQGTKPWEPPVEIEETPSDAKPVELSDASRAENVGKRVRFKAVIAGKDLAPYAAPAAIRFTCAGGLKICSMCSINANEGKLDYKVKAESPEIIRLVDVPDAMQQQALRKAAGIYQSCGKYTMKVERYHTIEDVRLLPEIGFTNSGATEYVVRQAFHVGDSLAPNNTYEFEGVVEPHPQSQYVTFILPIKKPVKDSVTGFEVTPEWTEKMKVFQPGPAGVLAKMEEIAADLTANVTRIYQRELVVHLVDLVYHSVLQFEFQKRLLKKGWTEGLIIGDTRCGKTETVSQLIEHYQAGELSTGENASFAGLIGGMQQVGSRWSIIWGKFPLNDRRLLVIDEVSGMPVEDIGRMSGVRSSGIAEIIKVQQEKTFARTRLLWLGNPRSARGLGTYDTGAQAIRELIGRPEDVARFDLACTVASGEVSLDVINASEKSRVPHIFTTDLCHQLVLWAWSRQPSDVHFTPEAEARCLRVASKMAEDYSPAIPLVEPAEQRIKIARLAVACAVRVFSTETGTDVQVLPEHVDTVHKLLDRMYTLPSMGYGEFSKAQKSEASLRNLAEVKEVLTPYGKDFVEFLLSKSYVRQNDIEDALNLDKKDVKPLVSKLVQNRALRHTNNAYVKTPAFIEFLRKLQNELPVAQSVAQGEF